MAKLINAIDDYSREHEHLSIIFERKITVDILKNGRKEREQRHFDDICRQIEESEKALKNLA